VPELVTSSQLAELLGVDRSTVARRIQAGKLVPTFKAPGRTGVALFDLTTMDIDASGADE
jgi:hypothetical protein